MSVPKIAGIETEYGILIRNAAESDPFLASRLLLQHWKGPTDLRERSPRPLAPSGPALSGPEAQTEEQRPPSAGLSSATQVESRVVVLSDPSWNLMLPNGARFYIDHAHPEYSTPEAATPRGVVAADRAGEIIVDRCAQRVNASGQLPDGQEIAIYKNSSDQKGASYGCHENYLLDARTFESLLGHQLHRTLGMLVPFLVTRVILCGAGKVGAENGTPPAGFQLSQRADFIETLIGLQTTYRRPLLNTRDEPHADGRRFRRLHIIVGDANMAEYSTFIKVGTTQLVLMMIEDDFIRLDLTLEDPVAAIQDVSRDLQFTRRLPLANGRALSAADIQRQYLACARSYLAGRESSDALEEVVQVWDESLQGLALDWRRLANRFDWAVKRNLLERYLRQQASDWDVVRRWQWPIETTLGLRRHGHGDVEGSVLDAIRTLYPTHAPELERYAQREQLDWREYWRQRRTFFGLRRLDLEYHDIARGAAAGKLGLFRRLEDEGVVDRLLKDKEIQCLVGAPPEDTRAYLRGQCIAQYSDLLAIADWSELTFRDPNGGRTYQVALPDPTAATRSQVGCLLEVGPEIATLVAHLGALAAGPHEQGEAT